MKKEKYIRRERERERIIETKRNKEIEKEIKSKTAYTQLQFIRNNIYKTSYYNIYTYIC